MGNSMYGVMDLPLSKGVKEEKSRARCMEFLLYSLDFNEVVSNFERKENDYV